MARPEVESLATEHGIKATILVEENGRGIYLYQRRGENAIRTDSHAGTRVYLHCTALGKALLSQMDEEQVNEIIDRHGLPARTDRTITDKERLFDALEQTRERGYVLDDEERISGIRCVAAPITSDDGDVLGSLSVSGSIKDVSHDLLNNDLAQAVQEAARVIEINHMYSE